MSEKDIHPDGKQWLTFRREIWYNRSIFNERKEKK
jgi:hypothetical protein